MKKKRFIDSLNEKWQGKSSNMHLKVIVHENIHSKLEHYLSNNANRVL